MGGQVIPNHRRWESLFPSLIYFGAAPSFARSASIGIPEAAGILFDGARHRSIPDMTTAESYESFLEAALPPLGLDPKTHRRRSLRRRVIRRMESVGLREFPAYLDRLRRDPREREILRGLLPVTVSRFFRNGRTFRVLRETVLPMLAARSEPVRAWSAGCASGEEAYSVRIAWNELEGTRPPLELVGTDVDDEVLSRAAVGVYPASSLREVPPVLRSKYFAPSREPPGEILAERIRRSVNFLRHDLLCDDPPGRFALVLCRNAAFTYFAPSRRIVVAVRMAESLDPGGYLVLGRTERLPPEALDRFEEAFPAERIYRRRP